MSTILTVPWDTGNVDHQIGGTTTAEETASIFTCPTTCLVTSVDMVWFRTSGHADDPRVRIYADSAGTPGTLLETSNTGSGVPVAVSTATINNTFAGTTTLSAGVSYWISCAPAAITVSEEEDAMRSNTTATSKQLVATVWSAANWPTNSIAFTLYGNIVGGSVVNPTLLTMQVG